MLRRYLFLALTSMLVAVLVYLFIRGRKIEAPAAPARPVEIVRQSHPTATRAIAPADLSVAGCTVKDGEIEVQIRNGGSISYCNVTVKISFEGKTTGAHLNQLVADTIGGGGTVSVPIQGVKIPPRATRCTAQVLYADVLVK